MNTFIKTLSLFSLFFFFLYCSFCFCYFWTHNLHGERGHLKKTPSFLWVLSSRERFIYIPIWLWGGGGGYYLLSTILSLHSCATCILYVKWLELNFLSNQWFCLSLSPHGVLIKTRYMFRLVGLLILHDKNRLYNYI